MSGAGKVQTRSMELIISKYMKVSLESYYNNVGVKEDTVTLSHTTAQVHWL